ncbi:hypothetical protein DVDV_1172 [Desulfovibrio sp. DV]|nr:hypothetical protein DVDV_1172 [Desulfovibrio sp. DV]
MPEKIGNFSDFSRTQPACNTRNKNAAGPGWRTPGRRRR